MRPSASTATSVSWSWPRSWLAEMKCSRRSSVHLTGRPSCMAAQGTSTSSGKNIRILVPKPPPTSGAMTSTLSSGRPSMAARPFLMVSGAWVESHT